MILYFSGTGNSRWAARQLAEHLGDGDIVSVNDALREGFVPALHSERSFVVVAPTFAWRLPRVVDAWLRDARFEGSCDIYFILTCGGSVGNAAKHARALCRDKGMRHRGLAEVVMPENYVALYESPTRRPASACSTLHAPSWKGSPRASQRGSRCRRLARPRRTASAAAR